jgi:signal transduction histidine kinase
LKRLFIIFGALAVLTILVSGISVLSWRWAVHTKDELLERYQQVQVDIERLQTLSERRSRKMRSFLLSGDPLHNRQRIVAATEWDMAVAKVARELKDPAEQRLLAAVIAAGARIGPVADRLAERKVNGAPMEEIQLALQTELQPVREQLDDAVTRLVERVEARNRAQTREANRRVANAAALLGGTIALAVLAAMVLGFSMYRAIRELLAQQHSLARAVHYQEEVMGIVGHDVRSPLSAILATASLASSEAASVDERRRMRRILRSARRIDALAMVLLDLTRFKTQRQVSMIVDEVYFHELVAEQIAHALELHREISIEHTQSGDDRARVDGDRLGRAIGVILEHAMDLARPGTTVKVTSCGEGPALSLEITIRGPPVAGSLLVRMFEPFGPSAADGGTVQLSRGLRLYQARELVAAHSGTLDVRTSEEGGLIFRVHLPRAPSPVTAAPSGPDPLEPVGPSLGA